MEAGERGWDCAFQYFSSGRDTWHGRSLGCPGWWWHCGVGLWWDAFPGWKQMSIWWPWKLFSKVSVPSINKKRERERQGNVNALPSRGFWVGLGYGSASGSWLRAVNPITLVTATRAVCLPSQLCSYSPTEPSLRGPQPPPYVWGCTQVRTDVCVCREPASTSFYTAPTAWYILSAALFILRAHYCFLTDMAHLGWGWMLLNCILLCS